jgi:diphosphomevalonate decarboxylase
MRVLVRAPSNIAWVKYMGKKEGSDGMNLPENPSISMTLSSLCTFVELSFVPGTEGEPRWIAEVPDGARGEVPTLDEKGAKKFIRHLQLCERELPRTLSAHGLDVRPAFVGACVIRTSNTFPASAGIASSASSFAGLTLAAAAALAVDSVAFRSVYSTNEVFRRELASLSRRGSGSSCRSFDGPFVAWEGESVRRVESSLPPLSDLVVVVSKKEKKVGSSEAHRRVKTSPFWEGRVRRAQERFEGVERSILQGDFKVAASYVREDSKDMHSLFSSSVPSFSYFEEGTNAVLDFIRRLELEHPSSTLAVTLDAGPNVHVIVPQAEEAHWKRLLSQGFPQFPILVDRQGNGAEIVEIRE